MSEPAAARAEPAGDLLRLVVGILGVWRITHLVVAEDGPWDVVARLRDRAGDSRWGELMDCFKCLSIWVAVPFAVMVRGPWSKRIAFLPALSAGAIVLREAQHRTSDDSAAAVSEES
jgi:hypothetical protein